jgi:hypothetical protein
MTPVLPVPLPSALPCLFSRWAVCVWRCTRRSSWHGPHSSETSCDSSPMTSSSGHTEPCSTLNMILAKFVLASKVYTSILASSGPPHVMYCIDALIFKWAHIDLQLAGVVCQRLSFAWTLSVVAVWMVWCLRVCCRRFLPTSTPASPSYQVHTKTIDIHYQQDHGCSLHDIHTHIYIYIYIYNIYIIYYIYIYIYIYGLPVHSCCL